VRTYRTQQSEVRALRGVAAGFAGGALNALIGPSGSGKSTLLRLLGGLDLPDAGEIEVHGYLVSALGAGARRRFRRASMWFVFQQPSDNFYPRLSIAEQFPNAREAWQVLDELGIGERLDHAPEALSGGEQQRAAFAQAVGAGANLVLADEPTAELDGPSARAVIAVMRALVERGTTVIAATHDPDVVAAADHVIALDHGLVKQHSPQPATGSRGEHVETPPGLVWKDRARPAGVACGPRRTTQLATANRARQASKSPPSADGILAAHHLHKQYRRGDELVHAVRDVSLSLHPAEVVGIVGRSGSGKSTLLNLLAGWEWPDHGTLTWPSSHPSDDPRVLAPPPWSIVAVVPQHLGLMSELTVRENVELPRRLASYDELENSHIDELLERLGLAELQVRYPSETSVGEQQRTALARALAVLPRVLLADEPTAHQDEQSAQAVFETIAWSSEGGTCCVVATHDASIEAYLDRALLMRDGGLVSAPGSWVS
jgi:putative ABC transport system ATP-binding protein